MDRSQERRPPFLQTPHSYRHDSELNKIYFTRGRRGKIRDDRRLGAELPANSAAGSTAYSVASDQGNAAPLSTPIGELVVPFSALVSRGLKMLIDVFEQQQIPLNQQELDSLTTGLSDLISTTSKVNKAAQSARGVLFIEPSQMDKSLASVDEEPSIIALVGTNEHHPHIVEEQMKGVAKVNLDETSRALATLGLASAMAEMSDEDFEAAIPLLNRTMEDVSDPSREQQQTVNEIRENLVKDLLASTTDTLPWLPLDGIVGTLPGFLVDRMGRTGEWLGTLASYWKSGAETIDNVAGGVLKPILNNMSGKPDDDYTGRNGLVENLNVPDEDVSIEKKIVTGAGIPTSGKRYQRYLSDHFAPARTLGVYNWFPATNEEGEEASQLSPQISHWQKNSRMQDIRNRSSTDRTLSKVAKPQYSADSRKDEVFNNAHKFLRKANDEHTSPLSQLKEILNRQKNFVPITEGTTKLGSFHSRPTVVDQFESKQIEGPIATSNQLIVGDDFDEEDEIFIVDDEDLLPPTMPSSSRNLQEVPEKELLQSGMINRMISNFLGGVERYRPAPNISPEVVEPVAQAGADQINGVFDTMKVTIDRQKQQLDDYLEQMAIVYRQPSPSAEAYNRQQELIRAQEMARHEEKMRMQREISQMVEDRLDSSLDQAEKKWKEEQERLWRELEIEREKNAQLRLVAAQLSTLPVNATPDIVSKDPPLIDNSTSDAPSSLSDPVDPIIPNLKNDLEVAETEELDITDSIGEDEPQFYTVRDGRKLVTLKEFIDSFVGSLQQVALEVDSHLLMEPDGQRRLLSRRFTEVGIPESYRDEGEMPISAGDEDVKSLLGTFAILTLIPSFSLSTRSEPKVEVDREFQDAIPLSPANQQMQKLAEELSPFNVTGLLPDLSGLESAGLIREVSDASKLFNSVDWMDLSGEWTNIRADLVNKIKDSVGGITKSVNDNPLSDIVKSLVEGLVEATPDNFRPSNKALEEDRNDNDEHGDHQMKERIAQNAASILRQISQKVIHSGPKIKSSATDLEIKQPDPDPIKKVAPVGWWF